MRLAKRRFPDAITKRRDKVGLGVRAVRDGHGTHAWHALERAGEMHELPRKVLVKEKDVHGTAIEEGRRPPIITVVKRIRHHIGGQSHRQNGLEPDSKCQLA